MSFALFSSSGCQFLLACFDPILSLLWPKTGVVVECLLALIDDNAEPFEGHVEDEEPNWYDVEKFRELLTDETFSHMYVIDFVDWT